MRAKVSIAVFVLASLPALAEASQKTVTARSPKGSSTPGAIQTGRKRESPVSRRVMRPEATGEEYLVDGRLLRMPVEPEEAERALAAVGTSGARQSSLAPAARAVAEGPQVGRRAETAPVLPGSYLHLVLKITKGNGAELLSVTELPGAPPTIDTPEGDFVLEVASGGKTVAVRSLSDPFAAHSFGGEKVDKFRPHHFETLPAALVTMDVPRGELQRLPLGSLGVRLLRIRPGPLVSKINPITVEELRHQGRLEPQIENSRAIIGPELEKRLGR